MADRSKVCILRHVHLAFALAVPLAASPAAAQSVEQFYRGKTLEFVIGYPPAGANDLYARALSAHFGGHLPGKPTVIVRNMPGAGSFVAANHMAATAAKDGTSIALIAPTASLDEKLGTPGVRFKSAAFNWIGRISPLINVIFMRADSPIKLIADAQKREATLAGTGAGSTVSVYPNVLNNVFGTKFKLVMGYRGSNEAMLAVERNEAEGHSTAWDALSTQHPDWLRNKTVNVIVQFGLKRLPALPDVPTALDLARTDEERQLLTAIFNASEIGISFFTTAGVPQDRVDALRKAFDDTVADPAFITDLKNLRVEADPLSGVEVQKLVSAVGSLSPELTEKLKTIYGDAATK